MFVKVRVHPDLGAIIDTRADRLELHFGAMDISARETNGGTNLFNLYVWPVRDGR